MQLIFAVWWADDRTHLFLSFCLKLVIDLTVCCRNRLLAIFDSCCPFAPFRSIQSLIECHHQQREWQRQADWLDGRSTYWPPLEITWLNWTSVESLSIGTAESIEFYCLLFVTFRSWKLTRTAWDWWINSPQDWDIECPSRSLSARG